MGGGLEEGAYLPLADRAEVRDDYLRRHCFPISIAARDDPGDSAVDQQPDFQGSGVLDTDDAAALTGRAVGGRWLRTVEGIHQLRVTGIRHGCQHGVERLGEVPGAPVCPRRLQRLGQVVGVVIAGEDLRPAVPGRHLLLVAHDHEQLAVDAVGVVFRVIGHALIGRHIRDAREFTGGNHGLDLLPIRLPVLEEHTRRPRHGDHIGIGSQRVFLQRILSRVRALLRVMVLNEGHRILPVGATAEVAAHERPVALVLLAQPLPVAIVTGITHSIAELEVKGGAGLLRAVNPLADGVAAVPALPDGELRLRVLIIQLGIRGRVALHHVVAEARVAKVIKQETEVGLHDALHVLALVVQVTHTVPSLSRIVIPTHRVAVGRSPFLGRTAVVIGTDIGGHHLILFTVPALLREVHPIRQIPTVINNDIGDGAETGSLESLDHRAQLGFIAEGAVVVVEPPEVVVAHGLRAAVTALRNPDKVERSGEVIGLLLKENPASVLERVPIEPLEHHTAIILWPALPIRAKH